MPTVHYISRASLRRLGVECPPRTPRRVRRSKLRRHDRRSGTSGDDSCSSVAKSGSNELGSPPPIRFVLALGNHCRAKKRKVSAAELSKHDAARGCDGNRHQHKNKKPRRELSAATSAPRTEDSTGIISPVEYEKAKKPCGDAERRELQRKCADEQDAGTSDAILPVPVDAKNHRSDTSDQYKDTGKDGSSTSDPPSPVVPVDSTAQCIDDQHRLFLKDLNGLIKSHERMQMHSHAQHDVNRDTCDDTRPATVTQSTKGSKIIGSNGRGSTGHWTHKEHAQKYFKKLARLNHSDENGTSVESTERNASPRRHRDTGLVNITGRGSYDHIAATLNSTSSDGSDATRMVSPECLKSVPVGTDSQNLVTEANPLATVPSPHHGGGCLKRANLVHDIVARVKRTFADKPGAYYEFLWTANMSKLTEVKSHQLVRRILTLLSGHHGLILGAVSLLEKDSKPEVQLTRYAMKVLQAHGPEDLEKVENISKMLADRMLVIVENAGGEIDLELILQALHTDILGMRASLPTTDALRAFMGACYWATGKNPVAQQAP